MTPSQREARNYFDGVLMAYWDCVEIADLTAKLADGFVSFSAENNKGETQRDAKAVAVGINGAATKIAASIREKIALIEAAIAEGKEAGQ